MVDSWVLWVLWSLEKKVKLVVKSSQFKQSNLYPDPEGLLGVWKLYKRACGLRRGGEVERWRGGEGKRIRGKRGSVDGWMDRP